MSNSGVTSQESHFTNVPNSAPIVEDGIARNASDHQMVHCAGGIDAGMSRHEGMVSAAD
jgi:hypothetical protein